MTKKELPILEPTERHEVGPQTGYHGGEPCHPKVVTFVFEP